MNRTQLTQEELEALQEKIINEHWMPHTEQFGHLEYLCQYEIEGTEYLLHKKSLMGVKGFILKRS